jgi:hypothetical protein
VKFKTSHLLPLLLICLVGAIFFGLSNWDSAEPNNEEDAPVAPRVEGAKLELGEDYYICPVLIETNPQRLARSWFGDKLESKAWDINGTAPDIQCNLTWNGNVVFTSSPKADSLIATWSPIGTDVANLISTGKISLDSVIQAATIKYEEGGSVTLLAWDNDGVTKEEICRVDIPLETLDIGENVIAVDDLPQVLRIVILAIAKVQPEAKLIQQLLMN